MTVNPAPVQDGKFGQHRIAGMTVGIDRIAATGKLRPDAFALIRHAHFKSQARAITSAQTAIDGLLVHDASTPRTASYMLGWRSPTGSAGVGLLN